MLFWMRAAPNGARVFEAFLTRSFVYWAEIDQRSVKVNLCSRETDGCCAFRQLDLIVSSAGIFFLYEGDREENTF